MRNQLSNEQVQEIFDFTAKKYVRYYDVQLELVDHICLLVEELMDQEKGLSFEKALHKIYKSFGIYGFTKIQEEKATQMKRIWERRMIQYLRTYLKLPKVLLAGFMSVIFFFLLAFFQIQHFWLQLAIVSILLFCPMFIIAVKSKKWKNGEISTGKRLLTINSLYQNSIGIAALIQLPFHVILNLGLTGTKSHFVLAMLSICFALVYLLTYGVLYVFPQWLYEDLRKDYAHLLNKSTYATA